MQITVTIDKAEVMAEVDKTAAYIGAKAVTHDGGNLYNNISTIKEDAEMLQRYWEEACSNVAAAAKDFATGISSTDAQWKMTLEMPDKYNGAFTGVLQQRTFSYIVSYIVACWLLLCGVEAAVVAVYRQDASSMIRALQDILYTRDFSRQTDFSVGDNTIGTSNAPDTGGDATDEITGDNTIGISTPQNMCGAEPDEAAGKNSIGGMIPQNFGPVKAIIIDAGYEDRRYC